MYLPDLAERLEAYRTLFGDARADVAQALLVDFEPLIGNATRVTYYRDVCGSRREWFHNGQYWFLIYLDEYAPGPDIEGGGHFVAYMKRSLTMRLLWERQRESLYQDRNQLVDLRPCGGDQQWPAGLKRALREMAVEIEGEALAFDDADEEQRLLYIVQHLPERERDIYLVWYYGEGRIPATSIAERYGIGLSRVCQLKQRAIATVSKQLAA